MPRRGWPLLLLGLASCGPAPTPEARLEAPRVLRRALSVVTDLEATARLVPQGGAAAEAVALTRADDEVSFAGFLPAAPGDYTLEVRFTGVPAGGGARLFLGWWRSDLFTVEPGDVARPTFSQSLDTLGAGATEGDPDEDGLANLDELLAGTDPADADTDADGLADGLDCNPALTEDPPFEIRAGGSLLDCDADGARRADAPFGPPGMDCDDRAPEISPAAEDDCATPVDEDCNPATCPSDDRTPPTIGPVTPAEGAVLGCHARIEATIEDASGVAGAQVVLTGVNQGADATLLMTGADGVFTSAPVELGAGLSGLTAGPTQAVLRATDRAGNPAELTRAYTLRFSRPRLTSMTPARVGGQAAPVTVRIEAEADEGLARIALFRAPKAPVGGYDVSRAVLVGEASASPAAFTVDPAEIEDGEHLLFPVITDRIGNELRPSAAVAPTPGLDGLEVRAAFGCAPDPNAPRLPVRVIVVGSDTGYEPATMRALLPEAIAAAGAQASGAELVQIVGFGLEPDGTVRLDDASSFTRRWVFGFQDPASGRKISVTWLTPAFPGPNPEVDPDAGNITGDVALTDLARLADSSEVVAARAQQGMCEAVTGSEDDQIIYLQGEDAPSVSVTAGGDSWRGAAVSPVTETFDCN